jgi:hypothetical protein
MKAIYDSASQVMAFLSPGSEDGAIAINKMLALAAFYARNSQRPKYEFISWEDPELFGNPNQPLNTTA